MIFLLTLLMFNCLTLAPPPASSTFSPEDNSLLYKFLTRFPATSLAYAYFAIPFKTIAYEQLIKHIWLLPSHSVLELWGPLRKYVANQLIVIRYFPFQDVWLDNLAAKLNQPLPDCSLEELQTLEDVELVFSQENHITQLKIGHLTRRQEFLKKQLIDDQANEASIRDRKKALLDVKATLDAPFNFKIFFKTFCYVVVMAYYWTMLVL